MILNTNLVGMYDRQLLDEVNAYLEKDRKSDPQVLEKKD